MRRRMPRTEAEWREATVLAEALLVLDSARQYGLLAGGPVINVDRCVAIVDEGARRGCRPTDDEIDAAAVEIAREIA